MNDIVIPSWYGWVVLVMVSPGLIVLFGAAIAFLFHRPPPAVNEVSGYFHVLGYDPKTETSRELTLQAQGASAARGLAQLQGIVVTDVTPIVMRQESPTAPEVPQEPLEEKHIEEALLNSSVEIDEVSNPEEGTIEPEPE